MGTDVDQNDRILTSVLRERSQHRGVAGVRSERVVVVGVLIVIAVAVGFQLAAMQRAGAGPAAASGAVVDPSTASQAESLAQVGAEVQESTSALTPAAPAAATVETRSAPASAGGRATRYIVQPGDSLQSIAARNHLSPATLVSVNDLEDPDILQPGLELIIPSTDGFVHVVESGETLRSIADQYGIQTSALIAANALSAPDNITVGLRLFVPRDKALASTTTGR
jgi:LysM repeat protein